MFLWNISMKSQVSNRFVLCGVLNKTIIFWPQMWNQAVLTANFPKVVLAGGFSGSAQEGCERSPFHTGLDVTQYTDMAVLRQGCIESSSPLSQFVWDLCENFMNVYHDACRKERTSDNRGNVLSNRVSEPDGG